MALLASWFLDLTQRQVWLRDVIELDFHGFE